MKWYHKRSFMVPFKFILIVQNNSEIFKSISYRYKFLVGARDPFFGVFLPESASIHFKSKMYGAAIKAISTRETQTTIATIGSVSPMA